MPPEMKMPEETGMLEDLIRRVEDGLEIGNLKAYAKRAVPCGLKGTSSIEIYLRNCQSEERLMYFTLCPGREPYYRPWIEVYCVNDRPKGLVYYDSALEDAMLSLLSGSLGPGGKFYIEYYSDRETSWGLARGFPPALTRQGYKLFNQGFTWFKDWYFSEGGHEGGQKIQGEKPLDQRSRARHLRGIRSEAQSFLDRSEEVDDYTVRAIQRADKILDILELEGCRCQDKKGKVEPISSRAFLP